MPDQKLILIVDDDYELSDGIRAVLESQGHRVDWRDVTGTTR